MLYIYISLNLYITAQEEVNYACNEEATAADQSARDWGATSLTFRPWSMKMARRMTSPDCPHRERLSPSTSTTPRRLKLNPRKFRDRELSPAFRRWDLPTSICSRADLHLFTCRPPSVHVPTSICSRADLHLFTCRPPSVHVPTSICSRADLHLFTCRPPSVHVPTSICSRADLHLFTCRPPSVHVPTSICSRADLHLFTCRPPSVHLPTSICSRADLHLFTRLRGSHSRPEDTAAPSLLRRRRCWRRRCWRCPVAGKERDGPLLPW